MPNAESGSSTLLFKACVELCGPSVLMLVAVAVPSGLHGARSADTFLVVCY